MDNQDWTYVTWDKRSKQPNETRNEFDKRIKNNGSYQKVVKPKQNTNIDTIILAKSLERKIETGDLRHKTIPIEVSKNIAVQRNKLKLSQRDLARKICLPENIIRDYEKINNNTTHMNNSIINKIEKVIGKVTVKK